MDNDELVLRSLRWERRRRGLSITKLARLAHVTRQTIYAAEAGRVVYPETFRRISAVLRKHPPCLDLVGRNEIGAVAASTAPITESPVEEHLANAPTI